MLIVQVSVVLGRTVGVGGHLQVKWKVNVRLSGSPLFIDSLLTFLPKSLFGHWEIFA